MVGSIGEKLFNIKSWGGGGGGKELTEGVLILIFYQKQTHD